MTRIIELDKLTINQIAAGEVIERPASVIKELIENSVDAKASNIEIRIKEAGLHHIIVHDDGIGMDEDDLLMSIRPNTTSKLKSAEDLLDIESFGFRGEALSSIASISRMSLITRESNMDFGLKINVEAGVITEKTKSGIDKGLRVEVRDLFFNMPIRIKFLKSLRRESLAIETLVKSFAFAHQDLGFRLFIDDKLIFLTKANDNILINRAISLLGKDSEGYLYPIHEKSTDLTLNGFFAAPMLKRRDTQSMHFFVNKRAVSDRRLIASVKASYRTLLEVGYSPICALNIELPKNEVDVNVHPRKAEVRFLDERKVSGQIISMLSANLMKTPWLRDNVFKENGDFLANEHYLPRIREDNRNYYQVKSIDRDLFEPVEQKSHKLVPEEKFSELRVIGQVMNTYLLLESEQGLVLVDQHAASERVVFQKIRQKNQDLITPKQLLIPMEISLDKMFMPILEELMPDLLALGLEIEIFGKNKALIRAIPSFLEKENPENLIRDLIFEFEQIGSIELSQKILEKVMALMSCHGSIRAGQKLSIKEINELLIELENIDFQAHCPHGRPIAKWFNKFEMKKWFDRT